MVKKQNLLSIGNLSKLSGVSIKSLRYYDRLGILKPAYTDPESGYRYYTFPQLYVVEAIKVCVELNIPLKDFTAFSEENGGKIYYTKLLEHGRRVAEKKIESIRNGLDLIDEFQAEIERTETYRSMGVRKKFRMPEKCCCVVPERKGPEPDAFYTQLNHLMLDIVKNGLPIGYETGLLYVYENRNAEKLIFADILAEPTDPDKKRLRLVRIPAGDYICIKTEPESIQKAPELFPDVFALPGPKIVIETELFTGDYDYAAPAYELRCSLPR